MFLYCFTQLWNIFSVHLSRTAGQLFIACSESNSSRKDLPTFRVHSSPSDRFRVCATEVRGSKDEVRCIYTFRIEGMLNLLCCVLRGSPDLSIASERSNLTHRSHEQASLSQHPLGAMSAILEDASSCCSLSQHSLSPSRNDQATHIHDEEHSSGLENSNEWQKEGKEQVDADLDRGGIACGLSSSIPVRSFQKLLETDLGVASNSAIPSSSESVPSQTVDSFSSTDTGKFQRKHSGLAQNQDSTCIFTKEPQSRPSECRKQPQGGSSSLSSQRMTTGSDSMTLSSRLSAISNITVRSTSRQTYYTTELPQLQIQRDSSLSAPGARIQTENNNTPIGWNITPANEGGVYIAGLQRALWSSGSQQAADGSFLTSHPVFQSTPAVLLGKGPSAAARLSPVYSDYNNAAMSTQSISPKQGEIPELSLSITSHQSTAGVTLATYLDPAEAHGVSHLQRKITHSQEAPFLNLDVPVIVCKETTLEQPTSATPLPTSDQQPNDQEPRLSSGRVHSLPSLSYAEKIDAWKASQSSCRSFHDNLSLQGFDGVSSNGREQGSVAEAVNLQQLNRTSSVASAKTSTPSTQTGSGVPTSADVEEVGGAVRSTSPSPFTHSHSHSSLGTIITPIQQEELPRNKNHLPLVCTDAISPGINSTTVESSLFSDDTNDQKPADDSRTGPVKTPALHCMDQYNGVNLNTNMSNMVSTFPSGLHAEQSFQASLGASSVVSLEVDNYAPYWTSRSGSPPHATEFNIEDRIPVSKNKFCIF